MYPKFQYFSQSIILAKNKTKNTFFMSKIFRKSLSQKFVAKVVYTFKISEEMVNELLLIFVITSTILLLQQTLAFDGIGSFVLCLILLKSKVAMNFVRLKVKSVKLVY